MARQRLTEHQQAIADRNVTAILDATEELLAQRGQATISAVAKHSGVSRVTVYAHFRASLMAVSPPSTPVFMGSMRS